MFQFEQCDLDPARDDENIAGPCNEAVPSVEWWQVKTKDGETMRSATLLRCKRHAAMLNPYLTRQRPRSRAR